MDPVNLNLQVCLHAKKYHLKKRKWGEYLPISGLESTTVDIRSECLNHCATDALCMLIDAIEEAVLTLVLPFMIAYIYSILILVK